jgi:hypothetical protein
VRVDAAERISGASFADADTEVKPAVNANTVAIVANVDFMLSLSNKNGLERWLLNYSAVMLLMGFSHAGSKFFTHLKVSRWDRKYVDMVSDYLNSITEETRCKFKLKLSNRGCFAD